MIDTLALTLTDYEVLPGFDFELQQPPTNTKTGETGAIYPLFRVNGSTITGSKAFHNGDRFNVDIEPYSPTEAAIACRVHLSVPRFATGSNYLLLPRRGVEEVLSSSGLEKELRAIGIAANIENATISRLDLTRNAICSEPPPTYAPLFQLLSMKRTAHTDFGGTGHLWRNGSQQLAVYDKLAEMKHKKMEIKGLPGNTLRFEHRLMKSRKVKTALQGIKTVADLKAGYNTLAPAYEKALSDGIFRYEMPDRSTFSFDAIKSQMEQFQTGEGYWLKRYKDFALMQLLIEIGGLDGVDTFIRAAVEASTSRETKSRVRRELEAMRAQAAALKTVPKSKKTYRTLYDELQSKVLLKAA
jgi:hypothetical protein